MTEDEFQKIPIEFLNGAVLIDDDLYWEKSEEEATEELVVPDEFSDGDVAGTGGQEASRALSSMINAEQVVDGFSNLGLICSTYRWSPGHNTFPNSTDKADLIILDWKLDDTEDAGDTAVAFLNCRLEKDLAGQRRLRYVVIYTDKPMAGVLEKLYNDITIPNDITLSIDGNSVDIRETNGPPLWRILYQSKNETAERDLAKDILIDFASFLGGMLPRMVMAGVAEIRSRTFEHLYRFNKALDKVVASHLLAKRSSELEFAASSESFSEFVIGLIVNDFSDALYGSPMLNEASSSGAVTHHLSATSGDKMRLNSVKADATQYQLHTLLSEQDYEKFYEVAKALFVLNSAKAKKFREGKTPIEFADSGHQEYARLTVIHLMNNYPRLWKSQAQLKSGTVVKLEGAGDQAAKYMVCVQPICDAVRLAVGEGSFTKFPFLELEQVGPEKHFSLVVQDGDNYVYLSTKHKLSEIVMASFAADQNSRDVRTAGEENERTFVDKYDARYRWISELKEIYAMEIQNVMSTQGGRVGSNKFEWFRSKSS